MPRLRRLSLMNIFPTKKDVDRAKATLAQIKFLSGKPSPATCPCRPGSPDACGQPNCGNTGE